MFFFFKQKTAYEMRISDWSSDVCSSDLREAKGFDHMDVALSIGVQQMVRSDLSGSGVMFSIDTETGFPHAAVISAAWGLGEMVVQGSVNPDKYMVFKPLLQTDGACPIIEKTRGGKALKMVYAEGGSRTEERREGK